MIPACPSSSPAFNMTCSAYKLNKQVLRTFNFKGSNIFFFCVLFFKDSILYQFLENRSEQSCMQFSGQIMRRGTCLDSFQWLPSMTPFSELLLKSNLFSYAPLTQDMECFLALWRLLFAWLCFCSIFFNCLKWPCMKIYKHAFLKIKHPCFTQDLGPPRLSSRRFLFTDCHPRSWSVKTITSGAWTGDLVYALGKRTEWLWTYGGQ